MSRYIDITGQRFGKLVALRISHKDDRRQMHWLCQCDCGDITVVRIDSLRSGKTLSCACLLWKHGARRSRAYKSWSGMIQRCLNPKNSGYKTWGGRGIKVCDRWIQFKNFFADMGERPVGLTLDRINNNGNYEPGNCRWATQKEQQNNRSNNKTRSRSV